MNLYTMTHEYEQLEAMLEQAAEPDEQQALTDTMEGLTGEIEAKVLACACVIRNIEASEAGVQAELDRLKKRKEVMANNVRRLKDYMLAGMKTAGIDRAKDDRNTVSVQLNPASVIVDDESKIPESMIRTKIEKSPDKKAIGDAIKAGQDVPGCHVERTSGLRIR